MTILKDFSDNYNRADAFDLTAPPGGFVYTTTNGPRLGITGNQLQARQSNGPQSGTVVDVGRPYVTASIKHSLIGTPTYPGSGPGIQFRVVDDSNFWAAYVTLGNLYVSKWVANVETVVGSVGGIVQTNGDIWLVDLPLDNTIVVKQNGVTKITLAADATHTGGGTRHGLCGYFATESRFDDLTITLKFGAANKIDATQLPSQGANGLAFRIQPKIAILDASNVIVTNYVGNVTASLFAGTGALIGTVTVAVASGIADFTGSGLGVSTVGAKTIRFSSGGLTVLDLAVTIALQTDPVALSISTQPSANYQSEVLVPQQPIVRLLDYTGALATTGTLNPTVTVGLDNTNDIINGTLAKAAVAAVTTYTDLNVNGGGVPVKMRFSSPGLTSVDSNTMNESGTRSVDSVGNTMGKASLPRSVPNPSYPGVITDVFTVGVGKQYATIQAAIDACTAQDKNTHTEIKIDPGLWSENLILKKKGSGTGKIILRTANALPLTGLRVGPATLGATPTKLTSTGGNVCTVYCNINAHDYIFAGLDITGTNLFGIFYMGLNEITTDADQPYRLGVDRCYMHGSSSLQCQRMIILHSNDSYIVDSYVAEIHRNDSGDTNAITVFNGGKRVLLRNTYFEAAGEICLFGGSDPYNSTLLPEDWTVQKCHFRKPLQWYTDGWQSKNLFELKNMRRILMEYCFLENSYHGAQNGLGFNIASINQDGSAPYSGVNDVTYRYNIMRNCNTWLATQGRNSIGVAVGTRRVTLHDNLGLNIYTAPYNLGQGYGFFWASGVLDFYIIHNLLMGSHSLLHFEDGQSGSGFANTNSRSHFDNNICNGQHFSGQGQGYGGGPIAARIPDCTFDKNVLIGFDAGDVYPASSYTVPSRNSVGFTDPTIFDIIRTTTHTKILNQSKLLVGSAYHNASSDPTPRDIGPDIPTILAGMTTTIDYSEGTLLAKDFPGGVLPQDYIDAGSNPPVGGGGGGAFPALGYKYLIITQQAAGTIAGLLTTQPIVKVINSVGQVDATFNGLMNCLIVLGDGDIVSGGVVTCVAGVGTFTSLTVEGNGPITPAYTVAGLQGVVGSDIQLPDNPCAGSRANRAGR